MVERIPDIILVLAIACGTYTLICVLMLLVAQLSNVSKRIPWTPVFYTTVALTIVWVLIR